MTRTKILLLLPLALAVTFGSASRLEAVVLDLDSFANGTEISGNIVSPLVSIDSSDGAGVAIFDTDPNGPNSIVVPPCQGQDLDLLVDQGNLLIVQNFECPDQTVPGVFDAPNDNVGGTIDFGFTTAVMMTSIDLADINGNSATDVLLTDDMGLTRTYSVPNEWTGDLAFATLDLTTLMPQSGPGPGGDATAMEDAGFNASSVISMSIAFSGSGGVNNIIFIPEPSTPWLGLLGSLGLAGLIRKRR
ncbi:MAG: hypothetical protein AAGF97_11065 [Planctomycetota bacterium]